LSGVNLVVVVHVVLGLILREVTVVQTLVVAVVAVRTIMQQTKVVTVVREL
jgi:hypothetical protein